MKSNITHPDLGELTYEKVYFEVERPIFFRAHFEEEPDQMYVGMLVDEFAAEDFDITSDERIYNYYLAPVCDELLARLESGEEKLKNVFDHAVLWISHRYSPMNNKYATLYAQRTAVFPAYKIDENSTLCTV